MTLIRSNPAFKQERNAWFHKHFNSKDKALAEIAAIFRAVDLEANASNEMTGGHINAEELYLKVLCQINDDDPAVCEKMDMKWLMQEMDNLLFRYPPDLFSGETASVLSRLKQGEASLSLLSNTAFVKGKVLRRVLDDLGLAIFFDFQLYSDEEGWSKPNSKFFRLMTDEVMARRMDVRLSEIVHVGDNPGADIVGAKAIGIDGHLINSNDNSISTLLEQPA
ncbi:MAG: HAD-IA family hydrolase [Bacteroidota bacterium]|nr:HAD-IA family hydrolase [Bacteroidota bacterium]MDP4245680.1 HAD-IA family hydrolase [Bacteroidota bacterium]MDP4253434.1 HAD-IA family hydrolase [Bacteroidota bacterium]MDP4256869.1 HAD-IA family hydrolase [Bacteroidota bacterium]